MDEKKLECYCCGVELKDKQDFYCCDICKKHIKKYTLEIVGKIEKEINNFKHPLLDELLSKKDSDYSDLSLLNRVDSLWDKEIQHIKDSLCCSPHIKDEIVIVRETEKKNEPSQ